MIAFGILVAAYVAGYMAVFLAVFKRLDAVQPDPYNSVSASLISLFWPAWLPPLAIWWACRGRRSAASGSAG